MANSRKLIVEIIGDSSSLERSFRRSSSAAGGFSRDISRAGRGVIAISAGYRGLARSVAFASAAFVGTAGITAALKSSITGFDQFSEAMQKTVGLADVAQGQVAGFSKQILQLATVVGKSPQELAQAFLFITSSGIDAAHAMDVLNQSAKASVAGLGDTATVADAVTSAMNAYGPSVLSAKKATDVLVATVREGKGEATEFAGVIGNVTALAAQLGVSFDQVGAALAAQTRLGTDAQTSATQLQRVFSTLVKVTPQSAKAFKSVGLNADELRKTLGEHNGLLTVLDEVQKAFAGNLPALAKAFGDVRAVRGVLSLVGNQAGETRKIFDSLSKSAGSTKTAFDAVSKDTAQQFRRLRASVQVAGIAIGSVFAPLASRIASGLADAAAKFAGFVNKVGQAKTVHAKVAVVWDGISGAVRSLVNAFERVNWGQIVHNLANAARSFLSRTDFGAAGRALGAKVRSALLSIGDAISRVNWQEVGREIIIGFGKAVQFVLSSLPAILDGIGRLAVKVLIGAGRLLEGAGKELGQALLRGITNGLRAIGDKLERLALETVLKIIEPFTHLPGFLGGGPFQDLKDSLKRQLDGMVSDAQGAAVQIQAALSGVSGSQGFFMLNPVQGQHATSRPPATKAATDAATAKATADATTTAAAAAKKTVETSFTLPFRLRLAQAKADASKSAADDLKVAREIRTFLLKTIPTLKGNKLIEAYEDLAQVNQQLADSVKKAAKTLHTQFKKADLGKLTAGLGLSVEDVRRLRARLSQVGEGGTVPTAGFGAFGVPVTANGTVIKTTINMDGKKVASAVTRHQQRSSRRNPQQRRGRA